MSASIPVSVMVFTLNEEIHLPLCLDSLHWCDDVIVVDSFSKDGTERIARERGARFFQNKFEGFGTQRNWALDNAEPKHAWILVLDADERVPKTLACELGAIAEADPSGVGAYRVRRRLYMWGRWLRYSSLYPTWVIRFIRRDSVRYIDRGHAETQEVEGEIRDLKQDLIDENMKGISEWFSRQNHYSLKDAEYELLQKDRGAGVVELLSADPLARRSALKHIASLLPGRAFVYFVYSYFWRRGYLDGKDGFVFCVMRSTYQTMVNVHKHDLLRSSTTASKKADGPK